MIRKNSFQLREIEKPGKQPLNIATQREIY